MGSFIDGGLGRVAGPGKLGLPVVSLLIERNVGFGSRELGLAGSNGLRSRAVDAIKIGLGDAQRRPCGDQGGNELRALKLGVYCTSFDGITNVDLKLGDWNGNARTD